MKCIELYSPFKMYNETYENLPILDYVKLYYMRKNVLKEQKENTK